MKRLSYKPAIALTAIFFTQTSLWAQEAAASAPTTKGITMQDFINLILGLLVLLLFMLVIYQLILIRQQIKRLRREVIPGAADEPLKEMSFFEEIKQKLSGLKPMEMEKDLIMQGHEYDGIQELDNGMPPWLRYFFLITIGFGIVYFFYYTILGIGVTQLEEYEKEMAAAQLLKEERMKLVANSIDENNAVFMTAEMDLIEGKSIFRENCATCHGELGGGGAGPNLTDEYWLHGGGIKNVFKTIKYGYIQKGMAPWQDKLTPLQIQKVASYVLSLQGTNPPDALPPAGEKWVEVVDATAAGNTDSTAVSTDTVAVK
jgi:cytochrome c oxidase cbb3-type subunit 3